MRAKFLAFLNVASRPVVAIGGAILIALVAIGATLYFSNTSPSGTYTPVVAAPITEEVDVSGAVQGVQTTDLSFQIPGQVSWIPVAVGDKVGAGQVLVVSKWWCTGGCASWCRSKSRNCFGDARIASSGYATRTTFNRSKYCDTRSRVTSRCDSVAHMSRLTARYTRPQINSSPIRARRARHLLHRAGCDTDEYRRARTHRA